MWSFLNLCIESPAAASVAFISVVFIFYNLCWRETQLSKFTKAFYRPPKLPLFGSAVDLLGDEVAISKKFFYEYPERYGPRYSLSIGNQHYFTSLLPEDVEPWLGDALLISSGEKWAKMRKLLTPSFHFKILEDFQIVFNEQSQNFVGILRKNCTDGSTFDICPYVTRCTLDIICETAMGVAIDAQNNYNNPYVSAIYRMSKVAQQRTVKAWLHPGFMWRLSSLGREEAKLLKILHGFTAKVIQDRKAELKLKTSSDIPADPKSQHSDSVYATKRRKMVAFLDLLLTVQNEGIHQISDEDIRKETDTFMFEGHDTTAASLSWTIFLLASNPKEQMKVIEEMDSIFDSDAIRPVTTSDLSKMKYLECCIKEALRLCPSVPFIGRHLLADLALSDGVVVPAGMNFYILTHKIHQNSDSFPNPKTFDPERFKIENSVGRNPFSYIPFSAGPRNCIGQKFALMEEKTLLANLFRNFRVEAQASLDDIVVIMDVIMKPKHGLPIKLIPRF